MPAVVDTSALLALVDGREPRHRDVVAAIALERATLLVPVPVVVETSQLISRRLGSSAEAAWLRSLLDGDWTIEGSTVADLDRAVALLERYHDAELGLVDATIVAISERLGAGRIYTLDRRDFGIVRPRHVEAFELLP